MENEEMEQIEKRINALLNTLPTKVKVYLRHYFRGEKGFCDSVELDENDVTIAMNILNEIQDIGHKFSSTSLRKDNEVDIEKLRDEIKFEIAEATKCLHIEEEELYNADRILNCPDFDQISEMDESELEAKMNEDNSLQINNNDLYETETKSVDLIDDISDEINEKLNLAITNFKYTEDAYIQTLNILLYDYSGIIHLLMKKHKICEGLRDFLKYSSQFYKDMMNLKKLEDIVEVILENFREGQPLCLLYPVILEENAKALRLCKKKYQGKISRTEKYITSKLNFITCLQVIQTHLQEYLCFLNNINSLSNGTSSESFKAIEVIEKIQVKATSRIIYNNSMNIPQYLSLEDIGQFVKKENVEIVLITYYNLKYEESKRKPKILYLFENIILIASEVEECLEWKRFIYLRNVLVNSYMYSSNCEFGILDATLPDITYKIYTPNKEIAKIWIKELETRINLCRKTLVQ